MRCCELHPVSPLACSFTGRKPVHAEHYRSFRAVMMHLERVLPHVCMIKLVKIPFLSSMLVFAKAAVNAAVHQISATPSPRRPSRSRRSLRLCDT